MEVFSELAQPGVPPSETWSIHFVTQVIGTTSKSSQTAPNHLGSLWVPNFAPPPFPCVVNEHSLEAEVRCFRNNYAICKLRQSENITVTVRVCVCIFAPLSVLAMNRRIFMSRGEAAAAVAAATARAATEAYS